MTKWHQENSNTNTNTTSSSFPQPTYYNKVFFPFPLAPAKGLLAEGGSSPPIQLACPALLLFMTNVLHSQVSGEGLGKIKESRRKSTVQVRTMRSNKAYYYYIILFKRFCRPVEILSPLGMQRVNVDQKGEKQGDKNRGWGKLDTSSAITLA